MIRDNIKALLQNFNGEGILPYDNFSDPSVVYVEDEHFASLRLFVNNGNVNGAIISDDSGDNGDGFDDELNKDELEYAVERIGEDNILNAAANQRCEAHARDHDWDFEWR